MQARTFPIMDDMDNTLKKVKRELVEEDTPASDDAEDESPVQPKGKAYDKVACPELTEVIGGANPEQTDVVPGSWVKIQGLASAAEHNGKTAIVFGFDPEKGRYKVFLANGMIGKRKTDKALNVKPQNVELISDLQVGETDSLPRLANPE